MFSAGLDNFEDPVVDSLAEDTLQNVDVESCSTKKSHLADGSLPSLWSSTLLAKSPFAHLKSQDFWSGDSPSFLLRVQAWSQSASLSLVSWSVRISSGRLV